MHKKVAIVFATLFLSAGCNQQITPTQEVPFQASDYSHKLRIGGQNLLVEIAGTKAQMRLGLSGREKLDDNQGMLFDFGAQQTVASFWMKGMKFNLDFIWIKNNKIIFITPDVPAPVLADENLELYQPPEPVNRVLEVNAGWAEKNKIKTGDEVRW